MRVSSALVVAASLAALVGTPATASSGAVPKAAGLTTFTSSASAARGYVDIPQRVVLPTSSRGCPLSQALRFTGTAEQNLLVLTRTPLSPASKVIWVAHLRMGDVRRTYDSECLSSSIAAGRYLVQYLHSPGTSRMQLRFLGLRGESRVIAGRPDGSRLRALPVVSPTVAEPATLSWGARESLAKRGSVLTVGSFAAAAASNQGQAAFGDCLRDATEAALPDVIAYLPGCPAGETGAATGPSGVESWNATLTSNLAAGSYGAGFWYLGTPTHRPLGAVSAWLTNLTA